MIDRSKRRALTVPAGLLLTCLAVACTPPEPPAPGTPVEQSAPETPPAAPAAEAPRRATGSVPPGTMPVQRRDRSPLPAPGAESKPVPPEARFYERREIEDLGETTASGVKVYTNEDLDKLGVPAAPPEPEGITEADLFGQRALVDQQRQQKLRQTRQEMIAQAEARIRELEAELARLDQRAAALRNPLLPPGTTTDDEKAAEEGLPTPERLKLIEDQREKVEQQIEMQRMRIRSLTPR